MSLSWDWKLSRSVQGSNFSWLRKLRTLKIINRSIYSNLYVSVSSPGILYRLSKIHKLDFNVNFQYRPIFAAFNWASYKLSKFIVPILSQFTKNEFPVKNAASFTKKQQQTNSKNLVMVSFDVRDLFTSFPLNESITICLDLLFDSVSSVHDFTRDLFSKMLESSVFSSVFAFEKKKIYGNWRSGYGTPLEPNTS